MLGISKKNFAFFLCLDIDYSYVCNRTNTQFLIFFALEYKIRRQTAEQKHAKLPNKNTPNCRTETLKLVKSNIYDYFCF